MRSHRDNNSRLGRLFELGLGEPIHWSDEELADILRHELRSSLLGELKPLASQIESLGLVYSSPGVPPLNTFEDLLNHPNPNPVLLRIAKDFAKTADNRFDHDLPPAVATALYMCLIAAGIVRGIGKITLMDDSELRIGLEWVQKQAWIEESKRRLAADALDALKIQR